MKQAWKTFATRPVPRYTSYPTAADFSPRVAGDEARVWAASVTPDAPISVYMHVPFCEKLCFYCGRATSVPNGYRRIGTYLQTLHQEIDVWAKALGPHAGMAHLHFGGGSPNALSAEDFKGLVDHAVAEGGRPRSPAADSLMRAFRTECGSSAISVEFATKMKHSTPTIHSRRFLSCCRNVGEHAKLPGTGFWLVAVENYS